jgi:hypothetical protein
MQPNKPLKLTPLCGRKIGAILTVGIGPSVFLLYVAAQLSGRALGRRISTPYHFPATFTNVLAPVAGS